MYFYNGIQKYAPENITQYVTCQDYTTNVQLFIKYCSRKKLIFYKIIII